MDRGAAAVDVDDPSVLVLTGEVDMAVAEGSRELLPELTGVRTVDMSGVTFIDSAGLGLVLAVARGARPARVLLRGVPAQALVVLRMFGADAVADVEVAPGAVAAPERSTGT